MSEFSSSVVFACKTADLHRSVFDERKVFDSLDQQNSVMLGPTGNFSYSAGTCSFSIFPDRLILVQKATAIFPREILCAAEQIATVIHGHYKPLHPISGIGMNLDAHIQTQDCETSGTDFCKALVNLEKISELSDATIDFVFPRWVIVDKGLRYDVSLRPELATEHGKVTLAVNVHQEVQGNEQLNAKVGRELVSSVQDKLWKLYERTLFKVQGTTS